MGVVVSVVVLIYGHCVACIRRMHGSCSECSCASIRPIVLHV